MISGRSLKKIILFWILPVIVLSAIVTFFRPFWYIACVKETIWENGVLYGVDEWDGKLRLFGCDADGGNAWVDTIYKIDDIHTTFYSVADLTLLEDGVCGVLLRPQEVTDINNDLYIEYDLKEKQVIYSEVIGNHREANVYTEKDFSNGTWTVTTDGSVWLSGENKAHEAVFLNDGSVVSKNNRAYTFGNEGLYFYNADADRCYVIDYTSKNVAEATDIPFDKQISSYGSLYSLSQMEDGTWTAAFYTEDGKLSPMVIGSSQTPLTHLSSPPRQILETFCLTACITFLIILLIKLFVGLIRRTFPTAFKIIVLSIPLLLVWYLVFQICIQNFLKDDVENRIYTQMYYTANMLNQQIDLRTMFSNREKIDIHDMLYAQNDLQGVYDKDGKIIVNVEGLLGHVSLFGYADGSFYDMNAGNLSCTAISSSEYLAEEDALEEMLTTKKSVKSAVYLYSLGYCLTMYHPILQDNNVIGFIRVIYPEINVTYEIMDKLIDLVYNIFIFLLAMVVFLTILCFWLLRPLNKIKHALSDFSVGIVLDEPPREGYGTEIKEMTSLFYHMTVNIQEHLQHIDQLERAYEPYIPQKLISLFGKKDIRDISPKDETVMEDAAILIMDAHGFAKAVSKAGTEEMIQFVDSVLGILTASVENAEGIVIQFTDTGVYAFFKNDPDQALQAAIAAQKDLQSLPLTLAGERIFFGAGMVCGDLRIGIIGDEERMEIRALSPLMLFAKSLQKISSVYHLGVLLDSDVVERMNLLMETDNIRHLGIVDGSEKQIYEVFEGQKPDVVMLKQITKKDFEAGVQYFQAGAYTMAKDCFIRVLRKNKDDLAAGRYLMLCSNRVETKEKGRNLFE